MQEILKAITKNAEETRKFAEVFARQVLSASPDGTVGASRRVKKNQAVVIGLEGELGSGKTTFANGFARGLGIKEEMKSPTFILMRVFKIKKINFLHFDAHRIDSPKEFLALGWRELLKNCKNILLIEWSDRVKKILPKNYFLFRLKYKEKNIRQIKLYG